METSTCNVCGFNGIFLSHRSILNRKCPECKSLERHRNFADFIKNKNVLHIAPERSIYKLIIEESALYYPIDKNPTKPFIAKDDLTDLNIFKNNVFDSVICFHVLEHILDDIKAIEEIKRVLKNDGLAFISVPINNKNSFTHIWTDKEINESKKNNDWGIAGKFDGHYRTYGEIDFINLLKKYFKEVFLSSNKKMTSDDFFICKK